MTFTDLTPLFEKRQYEVETLALKWDLDTKKFEKRMIRYMLRWRKGVIDWYEVEQNTKSLINMVINADVQLLTKWLYRCLRTQGYLKVNYPEVSYEPSFPDRVWQIEGQYRFKTQGIKRDKYIDIRFDKDTFLALPAGQSVFELAVLKEEPLATWIKKEDTPKLSKDKKPKTKS